MNVSNARIEVALGALALIEKQLLIMLTNDSICDTVQTYQGDRQRSQLALFEEYEDMGLSHLKGVPPPQDPAKREEKLPKRDGDGPATN